MSLAEAVSAIADEMENEAGQCIHTEDANLMRSYAKQLRIAVRASGGSQTFHPSSESQQKFLIDSRAKQEALKAKADAEFNEQDGQMVQLQGGGMDGSFIRCPANLPVGHKGLFNSEVYVKHEDGSIRFSQLQTEIFLKQRDESNAMTTFNQEW